MKTALIVDDSGDYVRSLQRALRGRWRTITADSVVTAQQVVANDIPDVALIDVRLSEDDPTNRDGVVLAKWFRTEHPQVPVVMMSGYRDFDAAVEAVNLGASSFLKKPIDLHDLRQALADATK